jgi:endonuclease YncB( thermonuclease family)
MGNRVCTLLVVTAALALAGPVQAEIVSYASVRDDASLRLADQTVRLAGIHIPDTGRTCRREATPTRCGSRTALALDGRLRGFVRCEEQARDPDGTIVGRCTHVPSPGGPAEDLAAFLLREGWAVAAPGAPFDYVTLERIARGQRRGIWGTPVDEVIRPRER